MKKGTSKKISKKGRLAIMIGSAVALILIIALARYETAHTRLGEIDVARTERRAKRANINRFLKTLTRQENLIEKFDEELWYTTVDRVKVYQDGRLAVCFRDGGVNIGQKKAKTAAA